MSRSVARQVASSGALVLVAALASVGLVTGFVLHHRTTRAQDHALLAAAIGRAHPEVGAEVEVEHVSLPIEVWLAQDGDPRIPADLLARARDEEGPLYLDLDERRVVLLPFEVGHGHDKAHGVAVAATPVLTLARSLGPFALVYTLVAAAVAALAMAAQVRIVRRAFRPLERTRAEAERVLGLGDSTRLTESGPVEVRALVAAMNGLLDRLAAAHAAQTRFTAEAAHELRTPVTSLLGELELARRSPRDPEADRALLDSLLEEVARLRQLVEGLTALARIDAGQVDHGRERLRAAELASSALSREAAALTAAGCRARLEIEADPELDGHAALLEVALANLLRNAARHAPGAEVVLTVDRDGDHARWTVDDGGPGVAEPLREALFDRFARAPEARRRDRSGLGLGLPIAREVARRHGGDCLLASSPLGGLRARMTARALPADPGF